MKKTIYLILLGLVCSVGVAWADETLLEYTILSSTAATTEASAGGGTIYLGASGKVEEKNSRYGFKCDGDIADKEGSSTSKYVKLTPSSAFAAGDIITIGGQTTSNGGALRIVDSYAYGYTTLQSYSFESKNAYETFTYTVVEDDALDGQSSAYVIRDNAVSSYVCYMKVVRPSDDTTAPTLNSSSPANNATNVAVSGNITLTFSENVYIADASKFSLTGGTGSLNTASATASGAKITIPYSGLALSTTYTLSTSAGAVQDASGNANAALSNISFTTVSEVYSFDMPVTYALTEGATFTSGQTVNVTDAGNIVATITYGEAGGNNFSAAEAEGNIPGFPYRTAGNGTNGNKTGGTWYTIIPNYDAVITIAVKLNSGKAFYIKEDGVALSNYNGMTVSEIYYGCYNFTAAEGSSYKIYCDGSKLGFYGFTMSPYLSKTITAAGWATYCSPYALDLENATGLTDAYIVTGGTNGILAKTSVKGGTVPANTGLLLKGDEGTAIIPVVASSSTDVSANKLTGVTTATEIAAETGWVLMNDGSHGLGFYQNASAFTVGANTAYILVSELPVPTPSGDAPARFLLEEEEHNATDIQSIEGNVEVVKFIENGQLLIKRDNVVYDTMGRIVR